MAHLTFLATLVLLALLTGAGATVPTRVLVVGGGPAGQLLTHALLSRYRPGSGHLYEVTTVEARSFNPLAEEADGPRAYSLGLNIRGQSALKHFDRPGGSFGLFHGIRKFAVESESFFLHIGKLKLQIRKKIEDKQPGDPPATLMIARNRLCEGFITEGSRLYGDRFDMRFGIKLASVDFDKKEAVLSDGSALKYDVIVGADGVNSAVRKSMDQQISGFVSEEKVLPGAYRVFIQSNASSVMEPDAIHAMECTEKTRSGFGLFTIPAAGNKTCVLITWRKTSEMPQVLRNGSAEEIKDAIVRDFPQFGRPTDEAMAIFAKQQNSVASTIKCSTYSVPEKGICLIGDACHSTGGTLGQGANSALQDVVALSKLLDETGDDVQTSLRLYSKKQQREGDALLALLALPPKGPAGLLYNLEQLLRGLLSKLLPRLVSKPMQVALSQTLTPFSEVVRQNALWVWLANRVRR